MAVLKANKVIRKKYYDSFKFIPRHIISEILARVASFTDLFNAKAACKEFLEAASEEEDYIFEHINIDSFPESRWKINRGASIFLEKCLKSGNPESLFRQGVFDYFSTLRYDSGLEFLKRATHKGHVSAAYVYGIILVCHGGQARKDGVKIASRSRFEVKECRKKVEIIMGCMWVNNRMVGIGPRYEEKFINKIKSCGCKKVFCSSFNVNNNRKNSMGWTNEEEFEDGFSCDYCLWDIEVVRFCNMLRHGRFRFAF